MLRIVLLVAGWLGSASLASAQLKVAEIFTNHMVLQQQTTARCWGWAKPGDGVTARCSWLAGQTFSATADADGRWEVRFPTPAANLTPQRIELATGNEQIALEDVLIGEVWLCSGQSNMEWRVEECNYTAAQTVAGNFPYIRHFKVNHVVSLQPAEHLDAGQWEVCTETSAQHFTAVGYFFAKRLAEKYGIPIGLVNSSWGGSQIESWISAEGMASAEPFKAYMARFPKNWDAADAILLAKVKQYVFGKDRPNPTAAEEAAYLQPGYDLSEWRWINPTGAWDWQNIWAFRGSGFMAFDFELSEKAANADAVLHLGHGDLPAEVFVNGQKIWAGNNKGGVETTVPQSALKTGANRLIFKQSLGDSKGWVEMGLRDKPERHYLQTAAGDIALGERWRVMPSFTEPMYFVHSSNNLSTAVFNGMIYPLLKFPIRGAIWYQGESNAARAHEYRMSFPLLIKDWRRLWGHEFPFLFVQLANWQAGNGHSNGGSEWAELREAQTMTLQLPKTGMAVAVDIGDSKDIHPKNKIDVGLRLAHEALWVAYGENLQPGSPTKPDIAFLKDGVSVKYPKPLTVRNPYGYVHGFEVAGADQVFQYAKAEVVGNEIKVTCKAVPRPVAIRYAWADDPNDVNVFTEDGFPLAPFRSDNWKGKTEGVRFSPGGE